MSASVGSQNLSINDFQTLSDCLTYGFGFTAAGAVVGTVVAFVVGASELIPIALIIIACLAGLIALASYSAAHNPAVTTKDQFIEAFKGECAKIAKQITIGVIEYIAFRLLCNAFCGGR